ncbi:MAG: tRNA U34 5-methylaminomethyl-2-thiouridine-forming methyltransferase MnmC [Chitinophagales bacterium]|jgi:tRNA U34 5-methylaminomethyl-2-thiouridine-forming methyltransferase MnmC
MIIVPTKDGSNTLLHEELGEHYHSIHGALQESQHIFIKNGLALQAPKKKIVVFEMGFGTGLNALLALDYAKKHGISIDYYSIEAYPISIEESQSLAYDQIIEVEHAFSLLHHADWNKLSIISENFKLHKIEGFLEETALDFLPLVDVVFYDAFAPNAQAHLWEPPILEKMFKLLTLGGHLSTYCAKGQFKRNLKMVGFEVKGVPGPAGKREITLAYKL